MVLLRCCCVLWRKPCCRKAFNALLTNIWKVENWLLVQDASIVFPSVSVRLFLVTQRNYKCASYMVAHPFECALNTWILLFSFVISLVRINILGKQHYRDMSKVNISKRVKTSLKNYIRLHLWVWSAIKDIFIYYF